MINELDGIARPQQRNEMREMIEELNSDAKETDGFSKIDLRTRLTASEIPALMAVDAMVSMNVLPSNCSKITRTKKRLAVSLQGKGREEMVKISVANQENKEQLHSLMDKMRGNN